MYTDQRPLIPAVLLSVTDHGPDTDQRHLIPAVLLSVTDHGPDTDQRHLIPAVQLSVIDYRHGLGLTSMAQTDKSAETGKSAERGNVIETYLEPPRTHPLRPRGSCQTSHQCKPDRKWSRSKHTSVLWKIPTIYSKKPWLRHKEMQTGTGQVLDGSAQLSLPQNWVESGMGSLPRLECHCQWSTVTFENSCGCHALMDMPEWREMTEQIHWREKKQPSQVACVSPGRSEVLRNLRHYLLAQSRQGHHTAIADRRREARKEEALDDLPLPKTLEKSTWFNTAAEIHWPSENL